MSEITQTEADLLTQEYGEIVVDEKDLALAKSFICQNFKGKTLRYARIAIHEAFTELKEELFIS